MALLLVLTANARGGLRLGSIWAVQFVLLGI